MYEEDHNDHIKLENEHLEVNCPAILKEYENKKAEKLKKKLMQHEKNHGKQKHAAPQSLQQTHHDSEGSDWDNEAVQVFDEADDLMDEYNLWQTQDDVEDREFDSFLEQNDDIEGEDDDDDLDDDDDGEDLDEEEEHSKPHQSLVQKKNQKNKEHTSFSQANCCKGPGGTKAEGEDERCTCASKAKKAKELAKIKELQEKRIKEAKEAAAKATETRIKMHAALKKAEEIKAAEEKKQQESLDKAKATARASARAAVAASTKAVKASYSTKYTKNSKDEQRVRMLTHAMKEIVIRKHESFTTLRTVKI